MFGTLLMLRSLTQTVYRQTFVWEPWESVSLAQCSGGSTTTSASTQQLYLFSHFYLTLMVSTTTATKNMKIVRLDDTHHSIIYYRNFLVKFINWKCPKCPNRTAYKSHVNNGRKKGTHIQFRSSFTHTHHAQCTSHINIDRTDLHINSQPENHHRISVQDHRATSKKKKKNILCTNSELNSTHTHTPNESHEYFINKFICYLLYRNFPIAAFWIAKVANATRVCLELKIHCIAVLIGELHEWWGE